MTRTMISAAAALTLSAPAGAQTVWKIDTAHSAAQFSVRHMMVSNVRGQFNTTTGSVTWDGKDLSSAVVDVTIDATSIDTREPKRDAHLKSPDFFDVAKYPTLTFKSTKVEPSGQGRLRITGNLTIHGVTRSVVLEVTGPTPVIKDPYGMLRAGASATTTINRKDFGLLWNANLDAGGVVVGDEVSITIDLELTSKAAEPGSEPRG
jgi:polyisoprenoid-binding protein YceI